MTKSEASLDGRLIRIAQGEVLRDVAVPIEAVEWVSARWFPERYATYYSLGVGAMVLMLLLSLGCGWFGMHAVMTAVNVRRGAQAILYSGMPGVSGIVVALGWLVLWTRLQSILFAKLVGGTFREYLAIRSLIDLAQARGPAAGICRSVARACTSSLPADAAPSAVFERMEGRLARGTLAIGSGLLAISMVVVAAEVQSFARGTEASLERHSLGSSEHLPWSEVKSLDLGCHESRVWADLMTPHGQVNAASERFGRDDLERLERLRVFVKGRGIAVHRARYPGGTLHGAPVWTEDCTRRVAESLGSDVARIEQLLAVDEG